MAKSTLWEYVSYSPDKVHFTIHTDANNHTKGNSIGSGPLELKDIEEKFHVFGATWTQDKIQFFVDDPKNVLFETKRPEKATAANWPFDQKYYLLLNVAVGGSWGGQKGVDAKAFPSTMEIDYVRIYQ